MKLKVLALTLFMIALSTPNVVAQAPAIGNGLIAVPVAPAPIYACYPADGRVFPVAMLPGVGCAGYAQSASPSQVATTYTSFTITLGTPVPLGQSVRAYIADYTPSVTPWMFCTIPAGGISCSATSIVSPGLVPFTVAVGDQISVVFWNPGGSQSFIIESAKWLLQ